MWRMVSWVWLLQQTPAMPFDSFTASLDGVEHVGIGGPTALAIALNTSTLLGALGMYTPLGWFPIL